MTIVGKTLTCSGDHAEVEIFKCRKNGQFRRRRGKLVRAGTVSAYWPFGEPRPDKWVLAWGIGNVWQIIAAED